jgi:hypothetical protein
VTFPDSPLDSPLNTAIGAFDAAVAAQDTQATDQAFSAVMQQLPNMTRDQAVAAGPQLAALLADIPSWPRASLAVAVGACVERGADAAVCAEPLLASLQIALEAASVFAERWTSSGGGDTPNLAEEPSIEELTARIGPADEPATREAVTAWWTLEQWERAAVAVLSDARVRSGAGRHPGLLHLIDVIEPVYGDMAPLSRALLVLDDEPLLVLHRPTRAGFRLRMTGVADNFQLHTLLGGVLVGGGRIPGEPPSAQAVAVSTDTAFSAEARPMTEGNFNLVAPGGDWIWNEGTPRDIPVVDGVRLLVLDPPPYRRTWQAGRFFPRMTASLELEGVLGPAEAERWFERVAEPKR